MDGHPRRRHHRRYSDHLRGSGGPSVHRALCGLHESRVRLQRTLVHPSDSWVNPRASAQHTAVMRRKTAVHCRSCYSCIASAACDAWTTRSRVFSTHRRAGQCGRSLHTGVSAVEPARRIGRQCPRAAARGFAIYTRHAIRGNTTIISSSIQVSLRCGARSRIVV